MRQKGESVREITPLSPSGAVTHALLPAPWFPHLRFQVSVPASPRPPHLSLPVPAHTPQTGIPSQDSAENENRLSWDRGQALCRLASWRRDWSCGVIIESAAISRVITRATLGALPRRTTSPRTASRPCRRRTAEQGSLQNHRCTNFKCTEDYAACACVCESASVCMHACVSMDERACTCERVPTHIDACVRVFIEKQCLCLTGVHLARAG